MTAKGALINRQTWVEFSEPISRLVTDPDIGIKAKIHFSLLITLLLGINGLNVVNSFVGRDFMTAIEQRDMAEFIRMAALYIGVFAISTLVSVYYRFIEERLGVLRNDMKQRLLPTTAPPIEIYEEEGLVAFDRLTLRSSRGNCILIKELSISIPRGKRVLINGPSNTEKVALFRATAGVWDSGEGRIIRPALDNIFFLSERPYFPPGTLREILLNDEQIGEISDEQLVNVLRRLDLERVLARARGFDVEEDWKDILSLDEQQLLACAWPLLTAAQFTFLDRPHTALGPRQVDPKFRQNRWERF